MKPRTTILLIVLATLSAATSATQGQAPAYIPFQGYLTDAADKPIEGEVAIRFRLPSFEEEDLDASLVPFPEEALGRPNPEAFAARVAEASKSLVSGVRVLRGMPIGAGALRAALRDGTLRTRHVVADLLFVLSRGQCAVDTQAWAATQERQIDAIDVRVRLRAVPP